MTIKLSLLALTSVLFFTGCGENEAYVMQPNNGYYNNNNIGYENEPGYILSGDDTIPAGIDRNIDGNGDGNGDGNSDGNGDGNGD